jgi:peptide/nickel transport system permease protein
LKVFILRRIGLALVTLLLVSILVFLAAQVLPGDVGRSILGPYAPKRAVALLDQKLGMDRPILDRYWDWLTAFIHGDWGTSPVQQVAVRPLVLDRLRNSLYLGAFAFVLLTPISIGCGVWAALKRDSPIDHVISIVGLSLVALPEFVVGIFVIVIFAIELNLLPVSSTVPSADPADVIRQLLLPAIPLVCVLFGYVSRMARASTIEALSSNYVRTAVLKGLSQSRVVWSHVLRNSMLTTVTVLAAQVGYLVGGLVVIETLFNYPGIGQLALNAANTHDIPILQATAIVIALVYTIANLTADILYAVLDPRIRLSTR